MELKDTGKDYLDLNFEIPQAGASIVQFEEGITVRDIMIADLDKVLAPELQALQGRRKELGYWHSEEEELSNDVDAREKARREREIDLRKRQILRELLNIDLARERMQLTGRADYLERRLAFLRKYDSEERHD